jgi:hypothetical protein
MRAPVPATASTQAAVAVATPDRWQSRFSAVRSAVRKLRTGARTTRAASPAASRSPSARRASTGRPPSPRTASSTARAAGTRHTRAPGRRTPRRHGVGRTVAAVWRPGRSAGPLAARSRRARSRRGRARSVPRSRGQPGRGDERGSTTALPAASRPTSRLARCQVSSRSGKSVRRWQPRLSVRVPAAASTAWASRVSAASSTPARSPGTPRAVARLDRVRGQRQPGARAADAGRAGHRGPGRPPAGRSALRSTVPAQVRARCSPVGAAVRRRAPRRPRAPP